MVYWWIGADLENLEEYEINARNDPTDPSKHGMLDVSMGGLKIMNRKILDIQIDKKNPDESVASAAYRAVKKEAKKTYKSVTEIYNSTVEFLEKELTKDKSKDKDPSTTAAITNSDGKLEEQESSPRTFDINASAVAQSMVKAEAAPNQSTQSIQSTNQQTQPQPMSAAEILASISAASASNLKSKLNSKPDTDSFVLSRAVIDRNTFDALNLQDELTPVKLSQSTPDIPTSTSSLEVENFSFELESKPSNVWRETQYIERELGSLERHGRRERSKSSRGKESDKSKDKDKDKDKDKESDKLKEKPKETKDSKDKDRSKDKDKEKDKEKDKDKLKEIKEKFKSSEVPARKEGDVKEEITRKRASVAGIENEFD